MGTDIDREDFEDHEYEHFGERVRDCLRALQEVLEQPGFGHGPTTIGAELELFLIDADGRPVPQNLAVLGTAGDDRVTLEIDRFNLEINPTPSTLAGRPFTALGREMADVLELVRKAGHAHGSRVAMIGILPTLRDSDLYRSAITDTPRYRALDKALARLREEPVEVRIEGLDPEPVEIVRDDVALEGANTSFQVHLRCDPDDFSDVYNAGQLAVAPVLAVAGNSPVFLGRQLWEETRIALFEQAVDDRDPISRCRRMPRVAFGTGWVRGGALELFSESVQMHEPLLPVLSAEDPLEAVRAGRVPHLDELRLHQGTVWRWNRAIYDRAHGGHVRLELRALPAGPTIVDMLANAAFLLGLTLALAPRMPALVGVMPFKRAHANFYEAAKRGLGAELMWPRDDDGQPEPVAVPELVPRLLPEARQALTDAGVEPADADYLLDVIEQRVTTGQTGAVWQRRALDVLDPALGRERALVAMLERYLDLQASEQPVHTWQPVR